MVIQFSLSSIIAIKITRFCVQILDIDSLTIFKQQDRSLTFEEFCEIAKSISIGEYQIINPKGIYEEIERRSHFIPMEQIENVISQAKIGRTEINQEIGLIRDKIQGRDEKTNSNTEERE